MKKLIIFITLILFNCAYFNTFYNAQKSFKTAQKLAEKRATDQVSSGEIGNYDKAIEKASVVLENHRNSRWVDDALLLIGKSFYFKGEYDRASIKFSELSENFSDSKLIPESNYWWALSLLETDNYNIAEDKFNLAIESNVHKKYRNQAYMYLAELLLMKNDYRGAIAKFEDNLEIVSDKEVKARMQLRKGQCYLYLEEFEKAKEEFRKIEDYKPSYKLSFEGKFNYALTLRKEKDYENAITMLNRLLDDQKNFEEFPKVKLEIASCLRDQEDYDEAIQEYDDIAIEYENTEYSAEAYYLAAEIYFLKLFNFFEARELYIKANTQKLNPEQKSRVNERIKDINTILTLQNEIFDRENITTIQPVKKNTEPGNTRRQQPAGNKPPAIPTKPPESSTKTKKEKGMQANNLFRLSEIFYEKLEAPDSSIFYLNEIINIKNNEKVLPQALFLLSYIYETYKEDRNKSEELMNRLITEYPNSPYSIEARKKMGYDAKSEAITKDQIKEKFLFAENLLMGTNNIDSIITIYKEIIEEFPESEYTPKSHYTLAWIYENSLFDNEKAIQEYETLALHFPETKYGTIAKKKLSVVKKDDKTKQPPPGRVVQNITSIKQLNPAIKDSGDVQIAGGEKTLKTVLLMSSVLKNYRQKKSIKLNIFIDKYGKGKNHKILEGSGDKRVDSAIIESFNKLRFIPSMKGGKPVEIWKEFKIDFPLISVEQDKEPERRR